MQGWSLDACAVPAIKASCQAFLYEGQPMTRCPAQVFGIFRDNKVSVDVVATSEISISLTLDPRCWPPHTCLTCRASPHEVHVCPIWAYFIKQCSTALGPGGVHQILLYTA